MVVSEDPRNTLIAAADDFYRRGWMLGTSGNISARAAEGGFWITASGVPKGSLSSDDFIHIEPDAEVGERAGRRPSAETSIHRVVYELLEDVGSVLHVHTIASNLVCELDAGEELRLPALEMVKGLGIWDESPDVTVPVLRNHADVPRIADDLRTLLSETPPSVPGFLIRGHGFTAWGADVQSARNHVELFDYLFRYRLERVRLGLG